jgi:hypothetical protein
MQKYHKKCKILIKRKKQKLLNPEEQILQRKIKKKRVKIEHTFAFFKKFKIFSTRYRNRRKRFGLRMNLIAGLYNEIRG